MEQCNHCILACSCKWYLLLSWLTEGRYSGPEGEIEQGANCSEWMWCNGSIHFWDLERSFFRIQVEHHHFGLWDYQDHTTHSSFRTKTIKALCPHTCMPVQMAVWQTFGAAQRQSSFYKLTITLRAVNTTLMTQLSWSPAGTVEILQLEPLNWTTSSMMQCFQNTGFMALWAV